MPEKLHPAVLLSASRYAGAVHPLNEMIRPRQPYDDNAILHIGSTAHSILTRHMGPSHLTMLIVSVLDEAECRALPLDPQINPHGSPDIAIPLSAHTRAALGGPVLAVSEGAQDSADIEPAAIAKAGVTKDLTALASLLRAEGK